MANLGSPSSKRPTLSGRIPSSANACKVLGADKIDPIALDKIAANKPGKN